MFNTTTIAVAAALVLGALATARAEDPETSTTRRAPPVVHARGGADAHPVPFSQVDKHRLDLQK